MLDTCLRWTSCLVALLAAAGCSTQEADELSYDPIHGRWNGADWSGGPATVRRDPERTIVVRIYEQTTQGDPCSLSTTAGRRMEIMMPHMAAGSYDAKSSSGFRVEMWDGLQGQSDPSSLGEIDQASKKAGDKVIGRARFGSMISGEMIEGSFSATVCEDLP